MEKSERLVGRLQDVAADLEDREAFSVHEHAGRATRGQRGCVDTEIRANLDNGLRLLFGVTQSQGRVASAAIVHTQPPPHLFSALLVGCHSAALACENYRSIGNKFVRSLPPPRW